MSASAQRSQAGEETPVSARRGPPSPTVFPLLPTFAPGSPLAIIDIDCDDRGDGKHTGTEMVFNTIGRMHLATW